MIHAPSQPYIKAQKQPLSASFCFPSPLTPSHGLREVLAIWMLLLYCERSLIASALPTASPTSQHGALAVCLISHYLHVIHCKEKRGRKKEKHQEGLEKREREVEGVKGQFQPPQLCRHVTCFLLRSDLAPFFPSQSEAINGALSQTSSHLLLMLKRCSVSPSRQEMMRLLPGLLCFCRIWLQTFKKKGVIKGDLTGRLI